MKKLNHCPMSIRVATLRSHRDDDEEEEEEEEKCIRRLCIDAPFRQSGFC